MTETKKSTSMGGQQIAPDLEQEKSEKPVEDPHKKGLPNFLGREFWIPVFFLLVAGAIIVWGIRAENDLETLIWSGILAFFFGGLAFASLPIIGKLWAYRKECWLEQEAKAERDTLRDKLDKENTKEKSVAERELEKEKFLIDLLKHLKDLKPSNKNSDPGFSEVYDQVKTDLTTLLKKHFKED